MAVVFLGALINSFGPHVMSPWPFALLTGLVSALVVVCVWLLLVLPLSCIPSRSAFWDPRMLTLIGAVSGALIVCLCETYKIASNPTIRIYNISEYISADVVFPCAPAMLIGGVAGFVMAKLDRRAQLT